VHTADPLRFKRSTEDCFRLFLELLLSVFEIRSRVPQKHPITPVTMNEAPV
jgi:hypothetical protein